MEDTIRQTDPPRQGLFYTQTPNDRTTSSTGSLVSYVGVPQNDQDLASSEYQLVLHSIKQDLRAVLQRQSPAHADVDLKDLMHPQAPQQLKDILQGLVYVAKIKDVANTRGGAQVSQHRRVLAQQTYNMLVQELSDVLQGPAVQRSLRDLSAGTKLDLQGNGHRNETVHSNHSFPAITESSSKSDITSSESSSRASVMDDDDTAASVQSADPIDIVVIELLKSVDFEVDDQEVHQDIMQILKARDGDVNNTEKKLKNLNQGFDKSRDISLQREITSLMDFLRSIQTKRICFLDNHDIVVEEHNTKVFSFKQDIYSLYREKSSVISLRGRNLEQLDTRIEQANSDYKNAIKKTKTSLDNLKQLEETNNERIQDLLIQCGVHKE